MKASTKIKMIEAKKYCDENDKSFAFTVEYIQDVANVDFDCVMKFLGYE